MKYLFFDVECANCLKGQGKICSLGYVQTDEKFQVLQKKDILVNPDAVFLLGNAKTGEGVHLAYPIFRFQWAHTFPTYYKKFEKLLTDPDTLVFGFAVFQDVSYLSYSCHRYQLPILKFRFFDVQKMEKEMHHRKNPSGLEHLMEAYQLPVTTYHKSDEDAFMTMGVFQALLKEANLTVEEALKKYKDCLNDTEHLLKQQEQKKKVKQLRLMHKKKVEDFFASVEGIRPSADNYDPFFWNKTFYIDGEVFEKEFSYLYRHGHDLYRKGGRAVRSPLEADYIILLEKGKTYSLVKNNTQYLLFEEFQKKIK